MKKLLNLLNLCALILVSTVIINAPKESIETIFDTIDSAVIRKVPVLEEIRGPQEYLESEKLVSRAEPAVVYISIYEEAPRYQLRYRRGGATQRVDIGNTVHKTGSGTGFFITSDGYLLTNKHVVADTGAKYTVNVSEDEELPAQVIYRDPVHDIAIIKVEGVNFPTIELGDSSEVRVGENVVGIGNALGRVVDSVSTGSVLGLNRNVVVSGTSGTERMRGLIETSAKLYPGDSGGPLLDSEGRAIGINAASMVGGDLSFAVPINRAKAAISQANIKI